MKRYGSITLLAAALSVFASVPAEGKGASAASVRALQACAYVHGRITATASGFPPGAAVTFTGQNSYPPVTVTADLTGSATAILSTPPGTAAGPVAPFRPDRRTITAVSGLVVATTTYTALNPGASVYPDGSSPAGLLLVKGIGLPTGRPVYAHVKHDPGRFVRTIRLVPHSGRCGAFSTHAHLLRDLAYGSYAVVFDTHRHASLRTRPRAVQGLFIAPHGLSNRSFFGLTGHYFNR